MADFYVKNINGELVPAKFSQTLGGSYIQDQNNINVNPINSLNGHYFDVTGNELINFNPNNFLIVPINVDMNTVIQPA